MAKSPIKLFITATSVRTGRGRIFRNAELTPDVLLASACLPTMFQAIEIDGEPYWDGGFAGNPTITPLVRESDAQDTILMQINPRERPGTPRSAAEILNRLNEVSFNATLMKELRMIALMRQIADPGSGEGARWSQMRMHRIMTEMMTDLGYSSKLNGEREFLWMLRDEGQAAASAFLEHMRATLANARPPISTCCWPSAETMGLLGILVALGLLIWLAFRGWSVLLLAPCAALVAAAAAGEPLLAHWTQTFMRSAGEFLAQFFPLFLLGALFGKLMDDSGSVQAIARFMTERLGTHRAMLAVILAGAMVTYGGVSLFVAFFVLAPMAQSLFQAADIPRRLMPAAIVLGTSTFTMSALPGTPAIQNAIPMPFFGTTPFAAPGLGIIASLIMLAFGMWWLRRAEARRAGRARAMGRAQTAAERAACRQRIRARAGHRRARIRPRRNPARLPQPGHPADHLGARCRWWWSSASIFSCRWPSCRGWTCRSWRKRNGVRRPCRRSAGCGRSPCALAAAVVTVVAVNRSRLPALRQSMDAGANASVLPAFSVASLVGFGAVVAALPGFAVVSQWVLSIGGGPLVSLAVATNVLAALTGSASGGMTIALDALGETYMRIAAEAGIDPALFTAWPQSPPARSTACPTTAPWSVSSPFAD